MNPTRPIRLVLAAAMLAGVVGCASNVKLDEAPVESRQGTPTGQADPGSPI